MGFWGPPSNKKFYNKVCALWSLSEVRAGRGGIGKPSSGVFKFIVDNL